MSTPPNAPADVSTPPIEPVTPALLRRVHTQLHQALQAMRPVLLEAFGRARHSVKHDKSVVTQLDIAVEQQLREFCAQMTPGFGFSGEESGVDLTPETFWLVDPIDGTEPFIRGLPFSTTMIALIHQNEPVLGIIYNFFTDEFYSAIKGQGATKNGHAIQVSDRPLERSFVSLNTGVAMPDTFAHEVRRQVAGVPKYNAFGAEAVALASGSIEGTIVIGFKGPWDYAAASVIMREAGARVENFYSDGYDYCNMRFVAAAPSIFPALKQLAEAAYPEK